MRAKLTFFIVFPALYMLSICGFSQISASSSAGISATIVKQVGASQAVNNEFGNGTVILTGTVLITPIKSHFMRGGIVLPTTSGTYTATSYFFNGSEGYSYTISYPTSPTVIKNGTDALQVVSFTSEPARDAASDLIAGVFVSVTPVNVTVSYN